MYYLGGVKGSGKIRAIIIHCSVCNKSVRGKTVHTSAQTNLRTMLTKYCLERQYPNIQIESVYLFHKDDVNGMVSQFEVGQTKSSNVHQLDYKEYYDSSGNFLYPEMKEEIKQVLRVPMEKTATDVTGAIYATLPKLACVN